MGRRPIRLIGIMGDIVEQHQPGPDRVFKIQDIQAGRRLIKPVPVTACVKSEQAAYDQTQRSFMRYDQYVLILMINHDLPYHREGAGQYADARLTALRCKAERV